MNRRLWLFAMFFALKLNLLFIFPFHLEHSSSVLNRARQTGVERFDATTESATWPRLPASGVCTSSLHLFRASPVSSTYSNVAEQSCTRTSDPIPRFPPDHGSFTHHQNGNVLPHVQDRDVEKILRTQDWGVDYSLDVLRYGNKSTVQGWDFDNDLDFPRYNNARGYRCSLNQHKNYALSDTISGRQFVRRFNVCGVTFQRMSTCGRTTIRSLSAAVIDLATMMIHTGYSVHTRVFKFALTHGPHLSQCVENIVWSLTATLERLGISAYHGLAFLTPRNKWWPQYTCRLVLSTIHGCFTKQTTVPEVCKGIKSRLIRTLFKRHDFLSIQERLLVARRFTVLFIIASRLPLLPCGLVRTIEAPLADFRDRDDVPSPHLHVGGGRVPTVSLDTLRPYVDVSNKNFPPTSRLRYVAHNHRNAVEAIYAGMDNHVYGNIPLEQFVADLTVKDVKYIGQVHGVHIPSRPRMNDVPDMFKGHSCPCCSTHVSVFALHAVKTNAERSKKWYNKLDTSRKKDKQRRQEARGLPEDEKQKKAEQQKDKRKAVKEGPHKFPPPPPSTELKETVVRGWCNDTSPSVFAEGGCTICGQLTPVSQLKRLVDVKCDLNVLTRDGMGLTRLERSSPKDPISEVKGPILDHACSNICRSCEDSLAQGLTPKYALANGLWLGSVPSELQDLSYAEQLLISRVRRNRCIVQVSSGMHKMKSNVIAFENPMPKIYQRLPPPIEDLDEVLAFIYTGPCRPSPKDLERTPLLVRRNKVCKALEWLKLNHADYHDLDIAHDNLESYPENGPPVVVTYRSALTNKNPEAVSAFDNETEEGVDDGPCPFVVNGVTGEKLNTMGPKALAAKAMKHLKDDDSKILAIGHAEQPESMYDNPQLYPMMFPWLFPYGLGGIGSVDGEDVEMSDLMHKQRLLMYHDKWFQMDPHFPLIAFNQEQMKKCTTGAYLLTERHNFDDIADRLMNIDVGVLEDLSDRLTRGERVKPVTPEEKDCYKLISDLDHVGGHVQGSLTSKRYMRNEIWSLISYVGAPSWFITFAPTDIKHPISLYYADTKETFSPEIRPNNECYRLIAKNPVAGARFFHFMVQMFIKHVLGVEQDHPGIYGNTEAYYGTVEQQGRLTLHLHLLLWISGSLTPNEIRRNIMDTNSEFQKKMVEYLESLCVGEFLTGQKIDVSERVGNASRSVDYRDPTFTMPEPPPPPCSAKCNKCSCGDQRKSWWQTFEYVVDDLLLRSNQHVHTFDSNGNNTSYCTNAKGECKRRFPRDTFEQTLVDPKTGALNLKKGEAWINTFTPLLTYILRCNSDVTSLLSGTAIKAVVAYVSDYITKPGLKTYSIFDVIRSIFDKNSDMIGGDLKRKEKVRKVFTQVVNSLTAKMEIGGPMASLYVLGNPDHYTGHRFVPFYWRGYVRETMSAWDTDTTRVPDLDGVLDKVVISKSQGQFIGVSKVNDYIFRPSMYEHVSLYDWIRLAEKTRKRRMRKKKVGESIDDPEFDESDDELNIQPTEVRSTPVKTGGLSVKMEAGSSNIGDAPLSDFVEDDIGYLNGVNDNSDDGEGENSEYNELDVMAELAEHVPKNNYSFRHGHPQLQTHRARMRDEDPAVVPNFLPNTLPRSDRGDREYYCCTMLTLFKPWRSGKDLKSELESWDKSFTSHEFSKRQLEIIRNFNVRYECLDARDDYSARRDKDGNGICYQWATDDVLAELDDLHDSELATGGAEFDPSAEYDSSEGDDLKILGKRGSNRMHEMLTAERTLKMAGWLDECADGLPDVGSSVPVKPEHQQPSKAWRAAVLMEKQAVLDERSKNLPVNTNTSANSSGFKPNVVEIVDRSYIDRTFQPASKSDEQLIRDSIGKFELNSERERAFWIIANHSTMEKPEKLRMYLGGMGGTGKSQVIKALIHFFGERKENHRFLVVAPTGAAAALLNGSTYHSVLGISDGEFVSAKSLAQIKARLDGVDYIFLDEVSMLSCRDMYKISAQAAKARGIHDEPFGGINFIFAGDFAQLPPARSGPALYSGNVGTQIHSGQSVEHQESAIGKALWHQITTVVILRQNMRQSKQSVADTKLRTALENMRYKSCTPDDILFLRSRIAGKGPNDPKLAQKRFRNVSIITARNTQRDKINELGCERFAAENGRTLHSFYSIDRWKNPDDRRQKNARGRAKKKLLDPIRKTNVLPPHLQRILWEQPHASSNKHVAGKLTFCVGLPVMLKHNDATECCITKGAEATVVGWQTDKGPEGQVVLDTLFVRLKDPPKTVKIDGLPENVVPITRHSTATMCYLPNDDEVSLSRDQVLVLPNFAMTDYSSQGRTRPDNVVDLNNCHSHQSYYTCLSRSASAEGTIIVQGFDPKVITGGASGYLRQEFRELELLDEITRLRYENELPEHVIGSRRNIIICQFQKWKGTSYVPSNVHLAIRWSQRDPLDMLDATTDSPWQIVKGKKCNKEGITVSDRSNTTGFVIAKGTVPVTSASRKRRLDDDNIDQTSKRIKVSESFDYELQEPRGFIWDSENYSCAYDSLMTILFSIWVQDPSEWKKRFKDMNRIMNVLASGFHRASGGQGTMESARNKVRHLLHQRNPNLFPYGQVGIPISEMSEQLLRSDGIIASTWLRCIDCQDENNLNNNLQTCVIQCPDDRDCTTSMCLQKKFRDRHPRKRCGHCNGEVDKITRFDVIPKVLVFSVSDATVRVSKKISFHNGGSMVIFGLKGVVYFGDFHYTARVCVGRKVWFHDDIATGRKCTYEKTLSDFTDSELSTCGGRTLSLVVYAQN